jgi:disulfide bond formation protein DsbB
MKKLSTFFENPRHLGLLVAAVSLASLCFAWTLQYAFHKLPCPLCYMQRWPYEANCLIGLIAAVLAGKYPRAAFAALLAAGLAFGVGVGISGFHIGVEHDWWEGLKTCGLNVGPPPNATMEELKKYFENTPIVDCKVAGWRFLGVSLTEWNFLASLFWMIFTFFHAIKGRPHGQAAPKA